MPFGVDFIQLWDMWKDYKKNQLDFTYKTHISEQAALNDLVKLSNGEENTAREIILKAIAKGWKGFYKLDNIQQNGKANGWQKQATGGDVDTQSAFNAIDRHFNKT